MSEGCSIKRVLCQKCVVLKWGCNARCSIKKGVVSRGSYQIGLFQGGIVAKWVESSECCSKGVYVIGGSYQMGCCVKGV